MDSISTVKLEPFRLDVTFKLTQFKSSPDLHLQVLGMTKNDLSDK